MTYHYQIWVVLLIGWKFASTNEKADTSFITPLECIYGDLKLLWIVQKSFQCI